MLRLVHVLMAGALLAGAASCRTPPLAGSGASLGQGELRVVLETRDPAGDGRIDALRILSRLARHAIVSRIVTRQKARVELHVPALPGITETLAAVLRPARLAFHFAKGRPVAARACAPLAALAERVAKTRGELMALERPRMPGPHGRCKAWLLNPEVILANTDVESTKVQYDPHSGEPYVMIELRRVAARRFAAATARNVSRVLAIVLDGEVISAPVVRTRIGGGKLHLSLGMGGYVRKVVREYEALAIALGTGALTTRWTVASIGGFP